MPRPLWEYGVVRVEHAYSGLYEDGFVDKLNEYGKKGWEVCGLMSQPSGTSCEFWMKRRLTVASTRFL